MDPTRPASPYSVRGIARGVGRAYQGAVGAATDAIEAVAKPFTRPAGYQPAAAPAAAAPAAPAAPSAQPASTVGGAISAIQARQKELANLADGGMVGRDGYKRGARKMMPGRGDQPHMPMRMLKDGGKVHGQGTGTSDSIPAMLSHGEYVLPADTTRKIGVRKLDAIREATHKQVEPQKKGYGVRRKMADGGMVDDPLAPASEHRRVAEEMQGSAPSGMSGRVITEGPGTGTIAPASPYGERDVTADRKPPKIVLDDTILGYANGGMVRGARRPKGYADGGLVTEEDVRPQTVPGGAVFGMYPSAINRRTSYAMDARLKTGQDAAGNPMTPTGSPQVGLPRGVRPSTAGAGRGSVNPELALVNQSVTPPQQPATAIVGAAPTTAAAQPAQPGSPAAEAQGAQGADTTSADRIAMYDRAGQSYRDIVAMQNAGGNQPASVMPDRQAERNAQFDREVLIDRATRIGGRGARALLDVVTGGDRNAAETANTATREAGANRRATMQDTRESQRLAAETGLAKSRQGTADAEAAVRIGTGRQQLSDTQRTAKLQAQFAAETDPAKRAALREQILLATGKDKDNPNRYTVVPGGQGVDPATGQVVREPAQVLDNQTGQMVQQGASAARAAPPSGAVQMLKANPALAAQFDQKYGPGAAARAMGQR